MNRLQLSRLQLSRRQFLGSVAALSLAGCGPGAPLLVPAPPVAPALDSADGEGSLKAHAAAAGVLYGCAVNVPALAAEPDYAALVRAQAAMVVAEDAMKWQALRTTPTTFDFDQADALIAFAESNRQKIRGHTLVWHRQLPEWFAGYATKENARGLLTEHVERVVSRYAGRMHSWDVVNEAVQLSDGRPDGLRDSPWLRLIGEDYIELAFRLARDADPQALLTYNEYGLEGENAAAQAKRTAVLLLLQRLRARNVPVDAVGIQAHLSAGSDSRSGSGLRRFLQEMRELQLQVFVTEMDVNDRALTADNAVLGQAVAQVYENLLDLVLTEPAVRAVLTWGITDRHTWLNTEDGRADRLPEHCLPFNAALQPAQAFYAVRTSFDRRASHYGDSG